MITRAKAYELRKLIEKASASLDDTDALNGKELYPNWDGNGVEYKTGDRFRYNGVLYKVLQDHVSQPQWTPDTAVSLYAEVLADTIKPWKQPDSSNPYMKGDKVYFPDYGDPIYESTIDNNVWSPERYPGGWKQVG